MDTPKNLIPDDDHCFYCGEFVEGTHSFQASRERIWHTACKPASDPQPDWEAFGMSIMRYWPQGDVDGAALQDYAIQFGILLPVKGGFNPEIHVDEHGDAAPGDPWFMCNYTE